MSSENTVNPHCQSRTTRTCLTLLALTIACGPGGDAATSGASTFSAADATVAEATITSDDLMAHVRRLSADAFEGRGPGTRGEDSAVAYIEGEFKRLGLKPGNPDGTYVQQVPLVGLTPKVSASYSAKGKTVTLQGPKDYLASTRRFTPKVDVENAEVVFVGYGVVAPEYGWDDYKGVDVKGKTIVMLVNDPPMRDPKDSTQLDAAMFKGKAMTYYGRWTYKYEIAAEKGAVAAIIVHETEPAGYPFEVLAAGWQREDFDIKAADNNMSTVSVRSWMPVASARKLFADGGQDYDRLKKSAASKEFRPVPLDAKITFHIQNTVREIQSRNVAAKIDGAAGPAKDEFVVYSAHWDHLGRDTTKKGDQIFNGALDNSSGIASLLEIAEAFTKLPKPQSRSILFLAVTSEEKGLLGAKYYANNPLYPLNKTVANINMDGFNQWGRTSDFVVIGLGNSTLDDVLATAAQGQLRTLAPDAEPEKGFFYRSDHFEFAKKGVPALYTDAGIVFVGKTPEYSKQKRDEYTNNDYHKVSDEIKPDWDLTGAVDDVRLLFEVGYRVSQTPKFPAWKPGTEFKARRDSMLTGGK
jgi:Zn-dependent M28 family amino/carboxypeptidase